MGPNVKFFSWGPKSLAAPLQGLHMYVPLSEHVILFKAYVSEKYIRASVMCTESEAESSTAF